MAKDIKVLMAFLGDCLGGFLGGCDGLLYVLITFVVTDYVTGVLRAIYERRISSGIGFKGITKKLLIFLLVGISHAIDKSLIGNGSTIRTAAIFFYCANEGISVLENVSFLGLPVPEQIKNILKDFKNFNGKK